MFDTNLIKELNEKIDAFCDAVEEYGDEKLMVLTNELQRSMTMVNARVIEIIMDED